MKTILATLIAITFAASYGSAQDLSTDIEGGYIFSTPYNKVRIPATGGTNFDLAKDLNKAATYSFRLRVNYAIKERHVISALYAPLSIEYSGRLEDPINYSGASFLPGERVNATYKFNSYRLTYRYMIVVNDHVKFGLGLTGKVREANISLTSENASADYPDLGIVPLINFYLSAKPGEKLSFLLEGDALGTKQGRAEDIFAGVTYSATNAVDIKLGYRVLEGGADVERNYNFAWINYAVAGVIFHF